MRNQMLKRNAERAQRIAEKQFDVSAWFDKLCDCWACKQIRLLRCEVAQKVHHEE